MLLVADGFETFVYSRDSEESDQAELVRSLGAHYVSSNTHSIDSLREASGKFHVVLEAVGFAPLMMAAIQMLKPNGVLALTGVPPEAAAAELNAGRLLRSLVLSNQVVFGTVNAGRRDYLSAIQHLEQFKVLFPESVRKLITHRARLDEVPQMLTHKQGIKNVVEMSRAA
jgi:threonine dehydrogenase-like Zn-dependent dehydrogenase